MTQLNSESHTWHNNTDSKCTWSYPFLNSDQLISLWLLRWRNINTSRNEHIGVHILRCTLMAFQESCRDISYVPIVANMHTAVGNQKWTHTRLLVASINANCAEIELPHKTNTIIIHFLLLGTLQSQAKQKPLQMDNAENESRKETSSRTKSQLTLLGATDM